jgi:hypothetical protein
MQVQMAAIAAAVGAAFAGNAQAATPIYGAGASAVKNSILYIIAKDYCSSASTITYTDNGTGVSATTATPGGSIFRITCTPTTGTKFSSGLDITYDSAGGSWKAFTATTPALLANAQNTALNANPVSTLTGGAAPVTITPTILGTAFTFSYVSGATASALTLTSSAVTFGLTDVEADLFADTAFNQPLVNNSWNTGSSAIYSAGISPGAELAGFPLKAFGVVFAIAASQDLYSALQVDQIASGGLPSTCVAGTVGTAANNVCAPVISHAQYASIVSANFGALNINAAALFTTVVPPNTALELARRDQGSGTQAASNAYFLNIGCASTATEGSDLAPALPVDIAVAPAAGPNTATNNFVISYNSSTGGVVTRLGPVAATAATNPGPTSKFVIGVVSAENEGKIGTAGFLRLDGVYPTNTAVGTKGTYNFASTEVLHANPNASGDGLTFVKDLAGINVVPTLEIITNYTGPGIVTLGTSSYNNAGTACAGWRHI